MATKTTSSNGKTATNRIAGVKGTTSKPSETTLQVPALELGQCEIEIVGTTSLLVHNFSEKSRRQMAEKQQQVPTNKKEKRDPDGDYFGAMYVISGDPRKDQPNTKKSVSSKKAKAVHGVPAVGFKKSMIRGAKMAGAVMTDTRCAFHIFGDPATNLVPIDFDECRFHEGIVRLQGKTADLRYRPEYINWSCKLRIQFNVRLIGVDQLVNLLRNAGFGVGLCEHRPECDGMHGMFTTGSVEMLGVESV
jgi:hypothetical protein